jgi:penicillin-binding protein 2
VTPLQLAVAYAAIANGGKVVKPRLVLRTVDPEGHVIEGPQPETKGQAPVSDEHLKLVREALTGVVNEMGGTGGRSRVPGIKVAGKTGTAQVVGLEHTDHLDDDEVTMRHRDHAWFVGYAPADAPEVVVAALVEHGGHGGAAAAPVVQKVLAAYFDVELQPPPVPAAPSPPEDDVPEEAEIDEELPPQEDLAPPEELSPLEQPGETAPQPDEPRPGVQADAGAATRVAGTD